jgi:hypothetical protein
MQLAEHSCFFQQRGLTGHRIVSAIHPSIEMVAAQHPLAFIGST